MDTETTFPRRGDGLQSSYDQALLNTISDAFSVHEAEKGLVLTALIGTKDFRRMYMSPTIRKVWDLSLAGMSMFVKKTDTVKQTSVGRLWTAELFVRDGMDGRIVLSGEG